MKALAWGICGLALGVLFVFVVGILSVQVAGLRAGAVFDLNNVVVAVTSPRVPFLQIFAIATLGGLVTYSFVLGVRKLVRPSWLALVSGFAVSVVVLIFWSFVIAPSVSVGRDLPLGILEGWEGWIQEGGMNPAVHVVFLLALGSLWQFRRAFQHPPAANRSEEAPEGSQIIIPRDSDEPGGG
ncbi:MULTISPECIES: hypothetical protein [unclassified Micromonospora]|uniref:hypothetical protein n=1 Tax=unclassified Micromonospora TaxID=2617518 RepID=UPI003A846BC4